MKKPDRNNTLEYSNKKDCKTLLLTESLSLTTDIAIDGPINGNQKIRTDIDVRKGLNNYSVVRSKKNKFPDTPKTIMHNIFNKNNSGTYLRISKTMSKEGGESANTMWLLSTSYLGG